MSGGVGVGMTVKRCWRVQIRFHGVSEQKNGNYIVRTCGAKLVGVAFLQTPKHNRPKPTTVYSTLTPLSFS